MLKLLNTSLNRFGGVSYASVAILVGFLAVCIDFRILQPLPFGLLNGKWTLVGYGAALAMLLIFCAFAFVSVLVFMVEASDLAVSRKRILNAVSPMLLSIMATSPGFLTSWPSHQIAWLIAVLHVTYLALNVHLLRKAIDKLLPRKPRVLGCGAHTVCH